jgi:hypothetical protein
MLPSEKARWKQVSSFTLLQHSRPSFAVSSETQVRGVVMDRSLRELKCDEFYSRIIHLKNLNRMNCEILRTSQYLSPSNTRAIAIS